MEPNGRIALSRLVHLGANHYLPPGTAARWRWMVNAGREKYGITLRITPDRDGLGGWNAYRPYDAQVRYKAYYGPRAAAAGYSSHGGVVNGRQVFAIDVDNWMELGWSRFAALCRLAGFTVDFVSPREEWHIGDFNDPWTVPAFTVTPPVINPGTTNRPEALEDDMPIIIAQRKNSQLAKGRYIGGGRIQKITRAENSLFRAAQAEDPSSVVYATVDDGTYADLEAGK